LVACRFGLLLDSRLGPEVRSRPNRGVVVVVVVVVVRPEVSQRARTGLFLGFLQQKA